MTKKTASIPINELFQTLEENKLIIALSDQHRVKQWINKPKPREVNKAPQINWEKNPKNYTGFGDPRYGTAIKCDWIPSLKRQLVVIDLDLPNPDKENQIPIEILKSVSLKAISSTYSVKTPSGGVHIYLLSKKKPKQPQPNINVDYQTNTGIGKGKYVAADWRWDTKGELKEYYKKLVESPDTVAMVDNSDDILLAIIQDLKDGGHIKTPQDDQYQKIAAVFKPYTENRNSINNFSLDICGYLRKNHFPEEATSKIIKEIFKGSHDLQNRLNNVKQTYERDIKKIRGISGLKEVLGKEDIEKLKDLTQQSNGDLKSTILKYIIKNKEPSVKILADYINESLELYQNLETKYFYEKTNTGQFMEIDERRIIEFVNDEFGVNSISSTKCIGVLKHITRPVEKNYDIVEFKNGILNTKTKEFVADKTQFNKTPKLVLNIDWNPTAEPGRIGQIIDEILTHPARPNDYEKWLRAVGHAFMGYNRLGKLVMVQGPSGTGKSTLTSILKRIFNYSDLSTSIITKNERFKNYPLVDKDVNIDDDINSGILKDIGFLNSVITGNAMPVEIKHEKKMIHPNNEQIPRLFANGNTLPPVLGEGFERRLLLIHAENKIDYNKKDDYLQGDIIQGKYDKDGLEWLVYTAINTYWDKIDEPITTVEDEAKMKEEYEYKSFPLKRGIELLFKDDFQPLSYIPVREVNMWVKRWCLYAFKENKISRDHKRPTNTQIKKAMDYAGFDQEIYHDGHSTKRVYRDIALNQDMVNMMKVEGQRKIK